MGNDNTGWDIETDDDGNAWYVEGELDGLEFSRITLRLPVYGCDASEADLGKPEAIPADRDARERAAAQASLAALGL